MKENKEQWNHRIKVELANGMREVQRRRLLKGQGKESLRDLTEEAIALFCEQNGVQIKEAA